MKPMILVCIVVAFLGGCHSSNNSGMKSAASASLPAAPAHNYVLEQDGEYGYQLSVSADDAQKGVAQVPLAMVRYLGKKDGIFTLRVSSDGQTTETTCKYPCGFVKERPIGDNDPSDATTMRATPGTLIFAILQDIGSGQLKIYTGQN
jgi:hypothetical protein